MKLRVKQDYQELRKAAYPDIREQLDALWKGGKDADDMRNKVLAVKAKFPKPPGGQP